MIDFILNGMWRGVANGLWTLLDLVLVLLVAFACFVIDERLARRRKRLAAECATWAESVTKQTRPPPMAQDSTAAGPILVYGDVFRNDSPGKREAEAIAIINNTLKQKAAATKVRRVTKRRK